VTRDQAERLGRIAAMAQVYAVRVGRGRDTDAHDLIRHGFNAEEVHDNWSAIVERGQEIIAAERGITPKEQDHESQAYPPIHAQRRG
jgi:hypothetical protein